MSTHLHSALPLVTDIRQLPRGCGTAATPYWIVTGAAGLIGGQMARQLTQLGQSVLGVDHLEHFRNRPPTSTYSSLLFERDHFLEALESSSTDPQSILGILHLGACANTTETNWDYLKTNNIHFSQRIWNWASQHQRPLIYASSAATYGDGSGSRDYDDNEKWLSDLRPLNLYGRSKHEFDLWVLEQEKNGNAPRVWAGFKFFNVYGWGEFHKKSMASVVLHAYDQICKTGRVKLFESHREGIAHGQQKRDFVSVSDVIQVLHFAREQSRFRGIYNLGTGEARSFLDLVHAVFSALKLKPKVEFIPTPLSIRDQYQYFTQAKMQKLRSAGYTSGFCSLEEGVAQYMRELS